MRDTRVIVEVNAEVSCEPGDEAEVAQQIADVPGVKRVTITRKSLLLDEES